jgi:tRNA-dihydrouridine synthase
MRNLLAENPVAIAIHGRTLKQGYKGDADWNAIGRAVRIARDYPTLILGNGDLKDMADVHRRVSECGVDGVLLGRAAQGNPWIFNFKDELKQALRCGAQPPTAPLISLQERFQVVVEHAQHYEAHVQIRNFVGMRKHLIWYCRDFRGAAELRSKMVHVNNSAEVAHHLDDYLTSQGSYEAPMPAAAYEQHASPGLPSA